MNEHYTSIQDPDILDKYINEMEFKQRYKWKETVSLFVLIAVGVTGLFYVLQGSNTENRSDETAVVSYFTAENENNNNSSSVIEIAEEKKKLNSY